MKKQEKNYINTELHGDMGRNMGIGRPINKKTREIILGLS